MDYWRGRPNSKHICMYFYKGSLPSLWPVWFFSRSPQGKTRCSLQR